LGVGTVTWCGEEDDGCEGGVCLGVLALVGIGRGEMGMRVKVEIPGAAVQDAITALRVAITAAPVSEGRFEREEGHVGVKCGGVVEVLEMVKKS
jgi:hypothetical protein